MARTFLEREADAAERLAPALKQVRQETEGLASGMGKVNQEASSRVGVATTGRTLTGPLTSRDRSRGPSRSTAGGGSSGSFAGGGRFVRGPGGIMIWQPFQQGAGVRTTNDAPGGSLVSMGSGGGGGAGGGFQRAGGGDPDARLADMLRRSMFDLVGGDADQSSPGGGGGDSPIQRAQLEATGAIVAEIRALRNDLTRGPSPGSLARSR